jgi:hypothetical protein
MSNQKNARDVVGHVVFMKNLTKATGMTCGIVYLVGIYKHLEKMIDLVTLLT